MLKESRWRRGTRPNRSVIPTTQDKVKLDWLDLLWIVFLGGLAALPPLFEIHKGLTLLAIGVFQVFEYYFLKPIPPRRAKVYSMLVKTLLATLLVGHTGGGTPINSSYFLIYFLPVISAALLYGPLGTLVWTALAAISYCSYLIPALQEYELTASGAAELALRNLFLFMAAIVVNRVVSENRRQAARYQKLAETLSQTNLRLEQARAAARRSERLAALGQLSAGLAHEIRNPLGVIRGSAETLGKRLQQLDPLSKEMISFISSEVDRLNSLVTRFLTFARPLQPQRHLQEITALLERAVKTAFGRWPEISVKVEREYANDLAPLFIDPDLCEQVFTNLVLNAFEAMPQGGVLRLRARPARSEGRPGIELEVEDSGSGISEELHEQIFNPFFTTKKDGIGLGLSLVSKIVEEHEGWVKVAHSSPSGTCFRLFFPAQEVFEPQMLPTTHQ